MLCGAAGGPTLKSPHGVVCSFLGPGRRWPSQPGHGIDWKNFELRHAQLVKGLAAHYGSRRTLAALLPPLLKLAADPSSRDSQAVAEADGRHTYRSEVDRVELKKNIKNTRIKT